MTQMVALPELIDRTEPSKPGPERKITLSRDSKRSVHDRILRVVGLIVEYSFGMFVGAVIGYLFGLYLGTVYVKHFEPVYFSDYSNLREIVRWRFLHYEFAGFGRIIGMTLGAFVILILNYRLRRAKK